MKKVYMLKPSVLPVIHYLDLSTALRQAELAFLVGADGVFLISHGDNADTVLHIAATAIKQEHPGKLVGLNLETMSPLAALDHCIAHRMDMVWVDNPGITSTQAEPQAKQIGQRLAQDADMPLYFASVAFKYQPHEPDPASAALAAAGLAMIPTTSGDQTGMPPSVDKIRAMREAIGPNCPLAIASGMSPENVGDYLAYATHFLVATNVSVDDYHFDEARLARFVSLVKSST